MKRALLSAVVVVVIDQLSKNWAINRLVEEGERVDLGWGAQLHLHFNRGAAFSSATSFGQVIGLIAIGMSCLLLWLAHQRKDRYGQVVLGVIAGGAVGNLCDRIFRAEEGPLSGAVIDFLRPVEFFAIFNVADAAIVVGVIAVLVQAMFFPPDEGQPDSDVDPDLEASTDKDPDIGVTEDGGPDDTTVDEGAELEGVAAALEDDLNMLDHEDRSDKSLPSA